MKKTFLALCFFATPVNRPATCVPASGLCPCLPTPNFTSYEKPELVKENKASQARPTENLWTAADLEEESRNLAQLHQISNTIFCSAQLISWLIHERGKNFLPRVIANNYIAKQPLDWATKNQALFFLKKLIPCYPALCQAIADYRTIKKSYIEKNQARLEQLQEEIYLLEIIFQKLKEEYFQTNRQYQRKAIIAKTTQILTDQKKIQEKIHRVENHQSPLGQKLLAIRIFLEEHPTLKTLTEEHPANPRS